MVYQIPVTGETMEDTTPPEPDGALLSSATVTDHLRNRGLLEPHQHVEVKELGGGVSNVVLAIEGAGIRWVVKQSLPRLRVAEDWPATQRRVITESRALRWAGRTTPGAVPSVVDVDPEAFVIVISAAPGGWTNWKEDLLVGDADSDVAVLLGHVLGRWHSETSGSDEARLAFDDLEAFDQLRIDPYYRAIASKHPAVAPAVEEYVSRMVTSASCLVHGDFSPKNILVGDHGELWVLDFEVAHYGDPAFDLAFLLHHLALKSVHRAPGAPACLEAAEAFLTSYADAAVGSPQVDLRYVLGHVGCLMLARVDGKSPAEYLTESERSEVRSVASRLLLSPPSSVAELWATLPVDLPS